MTGRAAFAGLCMTALLVFSAPAGAADFHTWMETLRQEARTAGISERTISQALPDSLVPDERVIRLDRKQPEGGMTFERYKNNVITEHRVREGQRLMAENRALLERVTARYGVEAHYIVALWGMETNYGKNMGGFDTIPSLVTMAYEGRRGAFFREELFKILKIVDEDKVSLHKLRGSWAGAMGQCQFMPSSFEKYAQDFDGDGKSDIWDTRADVFASAANYLSQSGWRKGEPWGVRVNLPKNIDASLLGTKVQKPAEFWRARGIAVPASFAQDQLFSVVQSGGQGYKAYIVANNYRIILKWNASNYFATAVGLLSDRLKN